MTPKEYKALQALFEIRDLKARLRENYSLSNYSREVEDFLKTLTRAETDNETQYQIEPGKPEDPDQMKLI